MADMVEVENAVRRTWVRELWMQWVPQQQVEVSLIAFLAMFSLAMLGSFLAGIFVQQYRQRHSHILSLSELLTFLPVEQSRRAIITTRHGYAFHVAPPCAIPTQAICSVELLVSFVCNTCAWTSRHPPCRGGV